MERPALTTCAAPGCRLETAGQYCEGHRKRDLYLRRTYGMTLADYYVLLDYQDGKCFMCGKEPRPGENLTVDHDHISRRVRGLLCTYCNRRVIGRHRDWQVLQRAADYLRHPPADYALDGPARCAPNKRSRKQHRPIRRVRARERPPRPATRTGA
jgi:recombination endonuclease VII